MAYTNLARCLTLLGGVSTVVAQHSQINLSIDASAPQQPVNPLLLSCHLDEGYVHASWSLYSQMIMGASFDEQSKWNELRQDGDSFTWGVDRNVLFLNFSTMGMALKAGSTGPSGITNRGMGNEGLVFNAGKPYEGWMLARADGPDPVGVTIALRAYTTNTTLDSISMVLPGNPQGAEGAWTNLSFTLTPAAATTCVGIAPGSDPAIDCNPTELPSPGHICVQCGGEVFFALQPTAAAPGLAAHVAYTYLQPGAWGRFAGLPVKIEGVSNLQSMGVTGLRVGGTYAQGIYWKDWRGPVWERPTRNFFAGEGNLLTFGMFEVLDVAAAMGIEPIITMSRNHSLQDLSDLVEYCYGDASTPWGAVRVYNDSHPQQYMLKGIELGNEQANSDWVAQLQTIEAKASALGLGSPSPFYYPYPENNLPAGDVSALQAAGFPAEKVMADAHGGWGGLLTSIEQSFTAAKSYNISGINCETNGLYSGLQRGLEEAVDMIVFDNAPTDTYGRVKARMVSFCNERSGHMGRYDQGASFWLPNMTWLQPPGWVHAMASSAWGDAMLTVSPAPPDPFAGMDAAAVGAEPPFPAIVSYSASTLSDGSAVFLRIVNTNNSTASVNVTLAGVTVTAAAGTVLQGGGNLNATNTPSAPLAVSPAPLPDLQPGAPFTLPPLSFAVITFNTSKQDM